MPFGKHKGVSLKDLPKDYIMWLLNKYETQYNTKLDEDLRTELMKLQVDIFKILAENSLLFKGEMKGVIYANALTKIYF